MRFAISHGWLARSIGVCLVAGALGGCVSQQEYDRLVDTNRSLSASTTDLQARLDDCQGAVGSLRGETGSAGDMISTLQAANDDLRRQVADAAAQMEEIENAMSDIAFSRLDPATDSALRSLAARYPGMISYDSDRGMLRFSSDLTFDSGSAQVKSNASQSLAALAQVLKSADASPYDVRIVGHTDAQKISANTAKRFPTNMHLSVARAISVRKALADLGVDPARMEAGGWGEYRPLVADGPKGNTPENRRVEIYLVKGMSTARSSTSGGVGSVEVDTERGTGGIEPIK
jgi:chemotaxis protein MotB